MEIEKTEKGIKIGESKFLPPNYSPSDDETEKIRYLVDRLSTLKAVHDNLKLGGGENGQGWKDYLDAYEEDTIEEDIGHKINFGSAYAFVETKHAEEITNSPKAKVVAIHKKDQKYAPLVDRIVMDEWRKSFSDVEYFKVNKGKNILGAGVMMMTWKKKIRKVYNEKGKLVDMLEYEGICNEYVPLDNFYPSFDHRISDIRLMDDCALRVDLTKEAFEEEYKKNDKYKNTEFVLPDGSDFNYVTPNREEEIVGEQSSDKIHLWFYYNKPKDWFCIVTDNNVIIFDGHLPCHKQLPFAIFVNHYQLNQLYGRSEVGLVKPISDYLNELNNTWLFSAKMGAAPPVLANETLTSPDYPELDFEYTPQAFWRVNDINSIKQFNAPAIGPDVYQAMDRLNNQMVFITGVNPYETMSRPGNESAYEKRRQYESMKTRIKADQAFNDMLALTRVFEQNLALIQEYYPISRDPKIYDDVSEDGYKVVKIEDYEIKRDTNGGIKDVRGAKGIVQYFEVTEDVLDKPFRIEVVPNSTIAESDALKQAQKNEIMQQLMPLAQTPAGQYFNWEAIVNWYVQDLGMDTTQLFTKDILDSADDENYKVEEGGEIEVHEKDVHADHIPRHFRYLKVLKSKLEKAKEVYKTLSTPEKRFILGKLENAINVLQKHIKAHIEMGSRPADMGSMQPQQGMPPQGNTQRPPTPAKPQLGELAGASVNLQNNRTT